ncbi:MAG: 50S ribosomal protein L22 [Candidatus Altimarinota bacterium]
MKAILRTTRITPKKANLIAGMIRKKTTGEALEILKYTPKKAAKMIHKLLSSAVANATNNFKQEPKTLIVKEVIINKGPTLKRGVPVSRGRVYPILKRTAHITVILGVSDGTAAETAKDDKAPKKAAAKKAPAKAKKATSKSKES